MLSFQVAKNTESYERHLRTLGGYRRKMAEVITESNMDTNEASLVLPFRADAVQEVRRCVSSLTNGAPPKYVVVIGIGGSNLGALAVHEAVYGTLAACGTRTPRLLCADTTDARKIADSIALCKRDVDSVGDIVICVISKSGGTVETMANADVIINALREQIPDIFDRVVVITDEGSRLWRAAQREGWRALPIPSCVGGRFSVFSSVGLFPLALAGVDVVKLVNGAREMLERSVLADASEDIAARYASYWFECMRGGYVAHNLFCFDTSLEGAGRWWRQLVGESIGKEKNTHGEEVRTGMIPLVSIGSTDLHSMAQLYFGGPRNIMTTLVTVDATSPVLQVSRDGAFSRLVDGIGAKTLTQILDAIAGGVRETYLTQNLPLAEIRLDNTGERDIGSFMQFQMVTVMYLAHLLGINAFDQPNVEAYKAATRTILLNAR